MTNRAGNLPHYLHNGHLMQVPKPTYNWAFLDLQNLYQGIKERGWKMNWKAFREYLYETHNVTKAVAFLGFVKENIWLYKKLRQAGFHLEFKETQCLKDGRIDGGNVDADLTSYIMDYKQDYAQAIVVADDGDYHRTLISLQKQGRLKSVISSHLLSKTSFLLRKALPNNKFIPIHSLRNLIESKTN